MMSPLAITYVVIRLLIFIKQKSAQPKLRTETHSFDSVPHTDFLYVYIYFTIFLYLLQASGDILPLTSQKQYICDIHQISTYYRPNKSAKKRLRVIRKLPLRDMIFSCVVLREFKNIKTGIRAGIIVLRRYLFLCFGVWGLSLFRDDVGIVPYEGMK